MKGKFLAFIGILALVVAIIPRAFLPQPNYQTISL